MKRIWLLIVMALFLASMPAYAGEEAAPGIRTEVSTDYTDVANWLKLPDITKKADTFYVYPASYYDDSEGAADVCYADNEQMRKKAEEFYEQQGTAYEESTNVFAPYYRQVNIAVSEEQGSMHGTACIQKGINDIKRKAIILGEDRKCIIA